MDVQLRTRTLAEQQHILIEAKESGKITVEEFNFMWELATDYYYKNDLPLATACGTLNETAIDINYEEVKPKELKE